MIDRHGHMTDGLTEDISLEEQVIIVPRYMWTTLVVLCINS